MNFLISAELRSTIINILDSHHYDNLCTLLEQLPAIIPGTIYTVNKPNSKVHIVTQENLH